MGPVRSRFFAHLPAKASVRPPKISPKSLFGHILPATPFFLIFCDRNRAYLQQNKDSRGEGVPCVVASPEVSAYARRESAHGGGSGPRRRAYDGARGTRLARSSSSPAWFRCEVESGLGKAAGAIARARFEGVGTFWPTVTFGSRVE